MKRLLAWLTILAVAFALAVPSVLAAPPDHTGGQGAAQAREKPMSAEAQVRVDALEAWIEALTALKDATPEAAHPSIDAALAILVDLLEAETTGKSTDRSEAAEALLALQEMVAGFTDLDTDTSTALAEAMAGLQVDLGVTDAELDAAASAKGKPVRPEKRPENVNPVEGAKPEGTGKPELTGLDRANAAREAAAIRLEAKLATMTNEKAMANIAALVEKLTTDLTGAGEAADEQEALAAIEAAVEAKAKKNHTDLDVQAEAEVRQGKKDEARATLKARLELNPHTRTAYEKLFALETEAGTQQELDTYVKGSKVEFDVRPFLKEGRTLVPIRALVEKLGATVDWDQETWTATITNGETTIVLTIGEKVALVNGEEVPLEVPAEIESGRTVIPARFVSEGLGLYVSWLAEHKAILVTEEPVAEE